MAQCAGGVMKLNNELLEKTLLYTWYIIIALIVIAAVATTFIVFGAEQVESGSYCVQDEYDGKKYLEYCLFNNKIISCSENDKAMRECIEANHWIHRYCKEVKSCE